MPHPAVFAAVTVILASHAETVAQQKGNPSRAVQLANMLVDAGVQAIYVSKDLRAQQTAQPLARRLGISPEVISGPAGIVGKLRQHVADTVLFIGGKDTIPAIVTALGVPPPPVTSGYDDLLIVTIGSGQPTCLRLHYGEGIRIPALSHSGQKESTMEIEFVRSGGFAGMATQTEGKLTFDGPAGQVTGASGYNRKLSQDEANKLQAMALAAAKAPAGSAGPGEMRDGYQYEVTITLADGTKHQIVTHGESDVTGIYSWVSAECEKIWKFRTGQ